MVFMLSITVTIGWVVLPIKTQSYFHNVEDICLLLIFNFYNLS